MNIGNSECRSQNVLGFKVLGRLSIDDDKLVQLIP
jgi:hypothetical protein